MMTMNYHLEKKNELNMAYGRITSNLRLKIRDDPPDDDDDDRLPKIQHCQECSSVAK